MNSQRVEKREKGLRRNYLFGDVATLIGVQLPSPALLRLLLLLLLAFTLFLCIAGGFCRDGMLFLTRWFAKSLYSQTEIPT